jgi:hypothetical protein
LADV